MMGKYAKNFEKIILAGWWLTNLWEIMLSCHRCKD
jgi:hypothetical protein